MRMLFKGFTSSAKVKVRTYAAFVPSACNWLHSAPIAFDIFVNNCRLLLLSLIEVNFFFLVQSLSLLQH